MKTRAAVLRQMGLPAPYEQSKPLSIETIELDPPGRGELLVRVTAAGLCHSDLSVIDGSRPRVMPMALGHEAAAEVVEVGPDTQGYAIGDAVVFSFVPACGHCAPCAAGRAALCEPGAKANVAGTLLSGNIRLHATAGRGTASPSGRLWLRRICRRLDRFGGQDRTGTWHPKSQPCSAARC